MKPTQPTLRKPRHRQGAAALLVSLALILLNNGLASATPRLISSNNSSQLTPATLSLWMSGSPSSQPTFVAAANAFEKLHPGIKIDFISEPSNSDSYFSLIHTSNIAHRGPDIEYLWTGYYVEQNAPWLVKLNSVIPAATQKDLFEPQYSSANYNTKDGIYLAPTYTQFYVGIYNTTLFAKAGITSPPADWSQLYSDCGKLKAIGVTPIEYGNDIGLSSGFYAAFDLGYLLAGVLSPAQWNGLYTGKIPWNEPAIVKQLASWTKLYKMGCTNSNVLTETNPLPPIASGKAAMYINGDWNATTGTFPASVVKHLGVFSPPYSATPKHNLVIMSGAGFAATSYGSHIPDAVAFLKFLETNEGQANFTTEYDPELMHIPASYVKTDAQDKTLLSWASSGKYALYPFIDNVTQPAVYSTAQSVLPAAFVGQMSAKAAMDDIEQTEKSLPASERQL